MPEGARKPTFSMPRYLMIWSRAICSFKKCVLEISLSSVLLATTFQELWGPDYSSVFAATMSYNRFSFLLSHLRLDNAAIREEARRHDKFAAARIVEKIFEFSFFIFLGCCWVGSNYSLESPFLHFFTVDQGSVSNSSMMHASKHFSADRNCALMSPCSRAVVKAFHSSNTCR
jgi:hypothetical protein